MSGRDESAVNLKLVQVWPDLSEYHDHDPNDRACPSCGHVDKRGWENPEGCGEIVSWIGPVYCGVNTKGLCWTCRRKRAPKQPNFHDAACDCDECSMVIKAEGLSFSITKSPGHEFGARNSALCMYPEKEKAFVATALSKAQDKIDAKFGQARSSRSRRHKAWLKWWRSW